MFRRILTALSLAGFLAVATVVPLPSFAAEKAKSAFSDAQLAELHAVMKQFILDNPQTLITSVETYYNKQNDTKKAQEGKVEQIPAGLYDNPAAPYAGDKNAKFTVVEFFDYNCGYCKQVTSDVKRIIDEEKNLKFVFIELPILSEMSTVAARYALAANIQGKYLPYHEALMMHQGPLDPTFLEKTAKDVGLDVIKLKKDADTQDIRDQLDKNVELARTLGIRGTPFFLIGKTKIPGAVGYSKMKEMILKERDGVTMPTAPTSTETPAAATSSDDAAAPSSDDMSGADPDVKQAIDDAKKETNDMLRDLQKQAEDMKKAAEDLAKQQAAAEKATAEAKAAEAKAAAAKEPAKK